MSNRIDVIVGMNPQDRLDRWTPRDAEMVIQARNVRSFKADLRWGPRLWYADKGNPHAGHMLLFKGSVEGRDVELLKRVPGVSMVTDDVTFGNDSANVRDLL